MRSTPSGSAGPGTAPPVPDPYAQPGADVRPAARRDGRPSGGWTAPLVTDRDGDESGDARLDEPAAARALAASYARMDGVGFLFGSIANLATGVVVGVEVLPRPRYAEFTDVLDAARGVRRTALDAGMAAAGLRWSAERGVRLPVHLDLLADTVAGPPAVVEELHAALDQAEVDPAWVVIEIGVPIGDPRPVLAGARRLRERGYRLLLDGVCAHDSAASLVTGLVPDQVKLHAELITGLDHEVRAQALAEVVRLCQGAGAEVVADGIETPEQLEALRGLGIRRGQGRLLAVPGRRPLTQLTSPVAAPVRPTIVVPAARRAPVTGGRVGTVSGIARAATTVPVGATGEDVRAVFRDAPLVTGVVLIDSDSRPVATLDRNRFMLSVSGPYGHALHARRPVRPMADAPRVLSASADPREALALLAAGDPQRRNDDVVMTDDTGRCVGIAHIADLLRGIAEMEYERALALHPVTGLGGSVVLERALERRLAGRDGFAIGWLVPDVEHLIDRRGFEAGEAAVRALARAVARAIAAVPGAEVSHVLDRLVVLCAADGAEALDVAARQPLRERQGPAVHSAWLTCRPGHVSSPGEINGYLARLLARARALGPDTGLMATPGTITQPQPLRVLSAIRDAPA